MPIAFVIVTRERKAVKRENEFSEAKKRFGARLFVSTLAKKYLSARKIEIAKRFESMISVFDIRWERFNKR